jgi:hypothetical protein
MTRTPWTDAERATLKRSLRYALAIFTAIAITLMIVGVLSAVLQG